MIDLTVVRDRWKEVIDRSQEVDPDDEYVWQDVLLGFLLGAGVALDEAKKIVLKSGRNGWPV